MKIIYEQTEIIKQILTKQKIDETAKYRRFFYLFEHPIDGGYVISNTLTYGMLFLTSKEMDILNNPDINNPDVRFLIEEYFLVPEYFDDKKLGLQVMNTRMQIQSIRLEPPLRNFAILPTTGCNARCFYCFEKGAKVSNMTEQTAHDIADFIERKGATKIKITWFGGEPLVNIKPIDIISKDLKEKNINFTSKMVTNAYLLDEEVIKKAVDLWNLKHLQITLDGTEEVYNKIKDYVYKNANSPFKRVLNNIENALKAGIAVSIRLNMDIHNAEDLFELSKLLVEKFNKYKNCHIYVVRLFEDISPEIKNRVVDDRHKLIEDSINLQSFIDANMPEIIVKDFSKTVKRPNTCMACNDSSVMIVPDGHLGKCEHYVDSDFFGTIYSDEYDLSKIQKYKEHVTVGPQCDDCKFRSLCLHVKLCTGTPNHCDDIDRKAIRKRYESKLLNIYNAFINKEKAKLEK